MGEAFKLLRDRFPDIMPDEEMLLYERFVDMSLVEQEWIQKYQAVRNEAAVSEG